MSTPEPMVQIHPGQGMLPTMGPTVGDRYKSNASSTICTVVGLAQRRYGWVTVRIRGENQELRIDNFLAHFTRI